MYYAALLSRSYTQHALRPFIYSETNHKRHFIKIPLINKGVEFIDLPSIFKDCNHLALTFSVCVKERQDRRPTMYWLPKLHKRPYKARFIANASSCTTTELSKLLTSCLTAVKNHFIRFCEKVYERSGKNLFWAIKNSDKVLNKQVIREDSVRPVCQLTTFSLSIPLCPII